MKKNTLSSYHNTTEIPPAVNKPIKPLNNPLLNASFFPILYDFNKLP